MRIAYLLSGFSRVYRDTAPLLKKNVLNILRAKHEVDIFISTWKLTDRGGYEEFHKDPVSELRKHYKNSNILIEKNWSFENRYVSDFYRRKEAWGMMCEEEHRRNKVYDIVFRDRMDTVHFRPFPLRELENLDEEKIYFPRYKDDECKDPFQDWIAYGSRKAMESYYGVYENIKDRSCEYNIESLMTETPKLYTPEWVLYAGLRAANRPWELSSYEVTPYDRHFGNRVHEVDSHLDKNGNLFKLETTIYDGAKVPDVETRKL